ncbi:hypothetical protein KEM56_006244, partial [Ascosphaera pollenicola]
VLDLKQKLASKASAGAYLKDIQSLRLENKSLEDQRQRVQAEKEVLQQQLSQTKARLEKVETTLKNTASQKMDLETQRNEWSKAKKVLEEEISRLKKEVDLARKNSAAPTIVEIKPEPNIAESITRVEQLMKEQKPQLPLTARDFVQGL